MLCWRTDLSQLWLLTALTPTWNLLLDLRGSSVLAGSATIALSATTATNLAAGVAGAVPYQTGAGATAFTAAGTAGYILTANGTAAPTWVNPTAVTVGNATNATNATNAAQLGSVAAASYALLLSPTFTGTPAAPTASLGTSTTQLATTAFVAAGLAALPSGVPPGVVLEFGAYTAPSGYLAVPTAPTTLSRTAYAALFAAIGTIWGAGDGSTTFGMPYVPPGYTFVQAQGLFAVGANWVGQVISHYHNMPTPFFAQGGPPNSAAGFTGGYPALYVASTSSTGGTANLAAGVGITYIVKY